MLINFSHVKLSLNQDNSKLGVLYRLFLQTRNQEQAAKELASLVDPKAAAISIVSQLDKQASQPPLKKVNGPAETGSLIKHKEMLNSKVGEPPSIDLKHFSVSNKGHAKHCSEPSGQPSRL